MTGHRIEPDFITGGAGKIFVLLRAPAGARQIVLLVPPFAEEMNKCRRQYTEMAALLAEAGIASLSFDLFGTGDSSGEFGEADWDIWRRDVLAARDHARSLGFERHCLLATRLGCALAADVLERERGSFARSVFWQPTMSGKQAMTQFLRLRTAASMMSAGAAETADSLKSKLVRDGSLEIAGYEVSEALWRGAESIRLADLMSPGLGELKVFEIGRRREDGTSPAVAKLLQRARDIGVEAHGARIEGEPFWTTTEIVVNPSLCIESCEFLTGAGV